MRRAPTSLLLSLAIAACGDDRPTEFPDAVGRRDAGKDATVSADASANMDAAPGNPDAVVQNMDSGPGNPDAVVQNMDAAPGNPDAVVADPDASVDAGSPDSGVVTPGEIQLISISDWHAQLDPLAPATGSTISIGGAAVLSTYFARERAANPNTLIVSGGDAYGASPPLSAFFDEEPAVRALDMMGLDVDTLGNHNFDRGLMHLQRMIDLANHTYVSSNLANLAGNLNGIVSPFHIETVGGVQVAFIGITNPDAALLVQPGRFGPITVSDPVAAATSARAAAAAAGAQVFVALVHMGATAGTSTATWSGPLIDFANQVSGFHVIFGDHTDRPVNMVINGQRVIENSSKGRTYSRVRIGTQGGIQVLSAELVSPRAVVPADPAVEAMLMPFRAQLASQLDGVMGVSTGTFPRANNNERLGEAAIGNLVADAMRSIYGTQIAFTNGGGLRAPIPSSYAPMNMALRRPAAGFAMGPPFDLVLGDAYTVLPFGNAVVTRTVTGAQLWAVLEHGVSAIPAANGRFAQVSGLRFTYTASAAVGSRVLSVRLEDGTPVPNSAGVTYTAATMDFTNNGGDGYTMLVDGQGTSREIAADVLARYITMQGTITPTISGRIQRVLCGAARPPVMGDLVINEIHADPFGAMAGDLGGDANGDGVRDSGDDEFVELVNVSGAVLDLTGVTISDSTALRHTFGATTLGCGAAVVVFGGGTLTNPSFVASTTGLLGLNNTGDTVTVALGTPIATAMYAADGGMDQSLVRMVEGNALSPFVLHTTLSPTSARFSPGTRTDGRPF